MGCLLHSNAHYLEISSTSGRSSASRVRKRSSACFVVSNFDDRLRPRAGTVRHVLLLPHLGLTGQEDADRTVAQNDSYRVVVGLGEELAWRLASETRTARRWLSPARGRARHPPPARQDSLLRREVRLQDRCG